MMFNPECVGWLSSENLYIKLAPCFDILPDVPDRALRNAAVFSDNERFDKGFVLVLIFLVLSDQVTDIIAGTAVMTGVDLSFNPQFHRLWQGNMHGCHGTHLFF